MPLTPQTNVGNWLAIDLGKNRSAFYAHLQPNSIRGKDGDQVRKGQVIARLGNSGNAVGLHLHFHGEMLAAEKLSVQARRNNSMDVSRKQLLSCWLRCPYLRVFSPTSSQALDLGGAFRLNTAGLI